MRSYSSPSRRLASLERDGWALESAEARHADNPTTFWIPPREDRDGLQIGQFAQLLFQIGIPDDPDGEFNVERMWVEVTGRIGDLYLGLLRNQPASIGSEEVLDHGASVAFRSEHIIDIRSESLHDPSS
jgi:hypothetical protein